MSVGIEVVESSALAGNRLGDPTARRVAVWLPPSYRRAPERRYPLILWLAGYAGTGELMFSGTPWQPGLGDRLDGLVADGKMGDVIVAAPDCFTGWGGAQYLDSPALGNYEAHVIQEVIPALDQRLRTIPDRTARAVGGKSSGGFGALVLAMRHPQLFSAVASHAGDMAFELSLLPELPIAARTLRRYGGVDRFLADFAAREKKGGDAFATMMVLATAGAYSPDRARDHGIALPFDVETGEIDWEIWRRWKAWDPIELAPRHADALRAMKLIYLDAGTRDEHNLDLGARILARRLRELGVACTHQEFDDGHRSTAYRYDVSLPLLAATLGARPNG